MREVPAKIKSGFWRTTLAANSEKGSLCPQLEYRSMRF